MLPMPQRARIAVVDLDQIEQRLRTALPQPVVERMTEAAKMPIRAIAQCKDAVAQSRQFHASREYFTHEFQR